MFRGRETDRAGIWGCGKFCRTFAQSDRLRRRFWDKDGGEVTGAGTTGSRDFAVALKFPRGLGDGFALAWEDGEPGR